MSSYAIMLANVNSCCLLNRLEGAALLKIFDMFVKS